MSLPPPPPGGPPQFQPQPAPFQQPGPYGQQPGPFQQPVPSGQPYQQFPVAGGWQQGPQPSGPRRPVSAGLAIAGLACTAVAAVGSVLPWATVDTSGFGDYGLGDISQDGLDADGKITIVLALIAAGFLIAAIVTKRLWTVITTTSIFAVTALIAVADIADVKSRFNELDGLSFGFEVSVGIGLWVLLLASIAGAIVSFIAIFARPHPNS